MAESFRTSGLPGIAVDSRNLAKVLGELRQLDPNLRKELVKEMKSEVLPIGKSLEGMIPGAPPLSGFSPGQGSSPYIWRKPRMTVRTPLGKKAKLPGTYPVVSIQFSDKRPNAGLSILELAGTRNIGKTKGGLTPQGAAMIRNLNDRYPVKGGLGRFIIPDFKEKRADANKAALRVLNKFAEKVNRRMRGF